MRHILARCAAILALSSALLPAAAQVAGSKAKREPAKMPDMVCWGSGPDWSFEFGSWGARYLGINQPDQDFRGHFFWASGDQAWVWQRTSGIAPLTGPDLTAVIRRAACTDSVHHKTYRYSAQVSLPQGDTVSGCCRKLRPGEAPVGPHGVPLHNTPNTPKP